MANLATSEHLHPYLSDVGYSTNLGSPSYTSITDLVELTPPGEDVGQAEDTQLQSAAATKEFGAGWVDGAEFTFTTYAVGTQDRALAALLRTMLAWRVTLPRLSTQNAAGDTATFRGFIKSRKPQQGSVGSDDRYKVQWTVKLSGPITLTAGS